MSEDLERLPSYDESLEEPPSIERAEEAAAAEGKDGPLSAVNSNDSADGAGPSSSPSALPPPPDYARYDPGATGFVLGAPFIYTTTGAPRYQLQQRLTHAGKPYQLRIRPLLPSESRRLSVASAGAATTTDGGGLAGASLSRSFSASAPFASLDLVPYDDDTSLYMVHSLGIVGSSRVEITGLRHSRTLPGHIRFDRSLLLPAAAAAGGACKFWHMTRNRARDSMREENQRRMQRRGYHAEEEWDRVLLFHAEGGGAGAVASGLLLGHRRGSSSSSSSSSSRAGRRWKDGRGAVLATEEEDGRRLELTQAGRDAPQRTREALLACWIGRAWTSGILSWEGLDDEYLRL
ncbi:hypothetical protein NKR23_g4221 [Pleurostoma richardsiae]|uniref:Uncharacterized protein n=1 Tax=Pleurostoma richardsiae TaxID=41990 RepID=A0AA38RRS5_9PEZI|nr:hypothetical protein NKR23_g4221 [Pleurostoma richardsiae]